MEFIDDINNEKSVISALFIEICKAHDQIYMISKEQIIPLIQHYIRNQNKSDLNVNS